MFRVEHCTADILLHDGDILEAAGLKILMIATPGHSKGSMCFLLESQRMLFSGDTLFSQSVGRCDFPKWERRGSFCVHSATAHDPGGLTMRYTPATGKKPRSQREKKFNPYLRVDISQW